MRATKQTALDQHLRNSSNMGPGLPTGTALNILFKSAWEYIPESPNPDKNQQLTEYPLISFQYKEVKNTWI